MPRYILKVYRTHDEACHEAWSAFSDSDDDATYTQMTITTPTKVTYFRTNHTVEKTQFWRGCKYDEIHTNPYLSKEYIDILNRRLKENNYASTHTQRKKEEQEES